MSPAIPSGRHCPEGFTLVELLVVLAIMASLVAVASFSIDSTQDKARIDKTVATGRQVVEALEAPGNFGFVSDFGRLPRDENEVKFLFSRKVAGSGDHPQEAAAHQFQTLEFSPSLPPGAPAGSGSKLANIFGRPELGVGWRGPYCLSTKVGGENGTAGDFLDGWKNEWEVLLDAGSFSGLRSLGRDGEPGGREWQDEDLDFPLRRNPENADLQGQVVVWAADGKEYTSAAQFKDLTLHIVYFTPDFEQNFPENAASGNIATVEFSWAGGGWVNPVRREQASANPFQFRLSGLCGGQRAFFIYAFGTPATSANKALYAGGVRLVHVQPGSNRLDIGLSEL